MWLIVAAVVDDVKLLLRLLVVCEPTRRHEPRLGLPCAAARGGDRGGRGFGHHLGFGNGQRPAGLRRYSDLGVEVRSHEQPPARADPRRGRAAARGRNTIEAAACRSGDPVLCRAGDSQVHNTAASMSRICGNSSLATRHQCSHARVNDACS